MKKASVVCAMDYFGIGLAVPEKAEGYACQVAGIDMVVHRALQYEGPPARDIWTVTEPTTGRAIFSGRTRTLAISGAERAIKEHGGAKAVRREIEKHGQLSAPASKQEGERRG